QPQPDGPARPGHRPAGGRSDPLGLARGADHPRPRPGSRPALGPLRGPQLLRGHLARRLLEAPRPPGRHSAVRRRPDDLVGRTTAPRPADARGRTRAGSRLMLAYIVRRLLLILPTILGILLINFIIVQAAPGGPVEQMIAKLEGFDAAAG